MGPWTWQAHPSSVGGSARSKGAAARSSNSLPWPPPRRGAMQAWVRWALCGHKRSIPNCCRDLFFRIPRIWIIIIVQLTVLKIMEPVQVRGCMCSNAWLIKIQEKDPIHRRGFCFEKKLNFNQVPACHAVCIADIFMLLPAQGRAYTPARGPHIYGSPTGTYDCTKHWERSMLRVENCGQGQPKRKLTKW